MTETTAIHFPKQRIENIQDKIEEVTGTPPGTKKGIAEKALDAYEDRLSENLGVDFS